MVLYDQHFKGMTQDTIITDRFKSESDVKTGLNLAWNHPFKRKTVTHFSSLSILLQDFLFIGLQSLQSFTGNLL